MKRLPETLCAALVGAALSGCISNNQQITERTFYEPNERTLVRREDGYVVGAIQSEKVRTGSRDEGDKEYSYGLVNFNK